MLHRALLDPIPPDDADTDTAAMVETARDIERGERHLKMLAELSEIAMKLARSLGELAQARIEKEKNGEDAPGRSEDATAAFDKMAQTVRRTAALEATLAAGVKARRETLITDRAERRAARTAAHETAVDDAIIGGLHDAYASTCPDAEFHDLSDRLLDDAREYLVDADEMRGYLDRPVGETVARLCAAMGLDPEACESDGETWRVRRPTLNFELRLEERARKYGEPHPSPEVGRDRSRSDQGGEVSMKPDNIAESAIPPHPDGFAVCPCPQGEEGFGTRRSSRMVS
jgi:hypothetical protein